MGTKSSIEWTDATINFWHGCKKISKGCKFCYMYRDKDRYGADPTQVLKRKKKDILRDLKKIVPGSKIFTCSWSDFFIDEADEWRQEAWDIIRDHPQFIWQILTKRTDRIEKCLPEDWGEGWSHVWLGASVESQDEIYRMVELSTIPAITRFLSVEPLLGEVRLSKATINVKIGDRSEDFFVLPAYHWVVIGGESGNDIGEWRYRECKIDWIEKVVNDCQKNQIPVFVKQMGTHLSKEMGITRPGGNMEEFQEHLRIRQFPIGVF